VRPAIAELKIWHGEKGIGQDIQQLLEQLTVRDTRALLIYFVRESSFSEISERAVVAMQNAPGYVERAMDEMFADWHAFRFRSLTDNRKTVTVNLCTVYVGQYGRRT
jgi:hypothetical protein